ncbi:DUF2252 domain-containing protein, partial [Streptomyces sp. 2MCAF27]
MTDGERGEEAVRRLPHVPGFAQWPGSGAARQEGKALRERVPRSAHRELPRGAGRPDAVEAVERSNA